jgi:transposase
LDQQINDIEAVVRPQVQLKPEFKKLLSIPGIGDILGLTIMSEVGDIKRFAKAGQYSSYCRCVSNRKISNGKKRRKQQKKGNHYREHYRFVKMVFTH